MAKSLLHLLITTLAIILVSHFVPGIRVADFTTALLVAFVLALINLLVRPVLLVLTLPINLLTLGLFTFILNGLLLWFVTYFVPGFAVANLWSAVLGSFCISVVSWLGNAALKIS